MKEQLDLEQSLRVKAETYAHEVRKRSQKHTVEKRQNAEVCKYTISVQMLILKRQPHSSNIKALYNGIRSSESHHVSKALPAYTENR